MSASQSQTENKQIQNQQTGSLKIDNKDDHLQSNDNPHCGNMTNNSKSHDQDKQIVPQIFEITNRLEIGGKSVPNGDSKETVSNAATYSSSFDNSSRQQNKGSKKKSEHGKSSKAQVSSDFIKTKANLPQIKGLLNNLAQQSSQDEMLQPIQGTEFSIQEFILQRHVLIFLGSVATVGACCLLSQCLVRMSKNYRLQLNKYYSKKRYEKAKLIQQYLNQEEQVTYDQAELDEEMLRKAEEEQLLQEQNNIGEDIGGDILAQQR
ncbi:UNKNOWN [Stylonychia lemnae]|uniref:Transmembrane protein n=1 Tax=Stylonychia lemnae TaxID=5949 RepID=A0A078A1I9_STYLE|nr:UNKNOWN [Stylonychia lemnae]|eukprot:CDW75318.1 UNKNOWN [Stylonychia lemnae]